ncbi:MAG TPA: hypothetical protein DDZ84_00510, partial [Firmicutes bacterium]|nr:hypothetical protein [Bacillota bacterium]
MMSLGRGRVALSLMLLGLCWLVVGTPAVAEMTGGAAVPAPGTGRLELTVLRDGADVTSDYMAVATSTSGAMPVVLTPSPMGALVADLPAGQYMIVVMSADAAKNPGAMTGQMGQMQSVMPTMLNVVITAGRRVSKVADVSGGGTFGDPDSFGDFADLGDLEDGTGEEGGSAGPVDLDYIPTVGELVELAQVYHDSFWELL